MAAMKLGNTPRLAAWSPPLASFSPPVWILAMNSSNSLPHLAATVRSAQAGRPRPNSTRFGPGFLHGCFSRDPLFVCTCMWVFDVVSFTVKAWILAMQASLFSGWVPEDLHIDASVLGSFGVMFIACLDSCRASWSSKVLGELIPKVSSLTLFPT
jgi:hypothetical protein